MRYNAKNVMLRIKNGEHTYFTSSSIVVCYFVSFFLKKRWTHSRGFLHNQLQGGEWREQR